MKKLIYLILMIVAFGLIVAGCIPVVPPVEQGEPGTLTKQPVEPYVAPTTYGDCGDLGLTITNIQFAGMSNPSIWEWFYTDIDHTVTTVGILYRSEDTYPIRYKRGILGVAITLIIRDSVGDEMARETKLSSCMGYDVCLWGGEWCFKYNGFTFETDVCGWPAGRYIAELSAEVNGYSTSYSGSSMQFEITQADINSFDCPPTLIEVEIDIKPGSDPNSINLSSKGVVPVAVLTTGDFDANDVDPDTVEFAGALPVRWTMEDVDGDDDLDMLFHFKTQDLDLVEGSTEAILTGETIDEISIEGTDTVNIVPKK